MRGKHKNRVNLVPNDIKFKIKAHIENFPKQESHYSRHDNSKVRYLSPELRISKMYDMYLEKYESDIFERIQNNENPNPTVKYKFYCEYFITNFNLSFGNQRSDTC